MLRARRAVLRRVRVRVPPRFRQRVRAVGERCQAIVDDLADRDGRGPADRDWVPPRATGAHGE